MVTILFALFVLILCLSILFGAWDKLICRLQGGCNFCYLCGDCHQCGRKLDAKR